MMPPRPHRSPSRSDLEAYWMPFTRESPVQGEAAPARQGEGYALLDARRPADPRRRRGPVVRECRSRPTEITEAVATQLETLDFAPPFQMGHPAAFELANAVVKIAPEGLDHVFFTNSGSESVDTALKIALAYHRVRGQGARTRLIGRERALSRREHGRHVRRWHRAEPQVLVGER